MTSIDTRSDAAARSARRTRQLQAELRRIRRVLAAQPSVRQLVLFGSVAAGGAHAASDLDLVVIEDTGAPFVDRALRLARVVRPRVGVQFLLCTPAELRAMARRPFVHREILRRGRMVPLDPPGGAGRCLAFAQEDLRMAELALGADIFNQTCFHAQQAAEKSLKACGAMTGEPLLRTHLIVDLLQELPASARAVFGHLESQLAALDQLYIPTRYPDALPGSLPEGLPGRSHAESALAVARQCFEQVRRWIDEQQASPPDGDSDGD